MYYYMYLNKKRTSQKYVTKWKKYMYKLIQHTDTIFNIAVLTNIVEIIGK